MTLWYCTVSKILEDVLIESKDMEEVGQNEKWNTLTSTS